MYHVSARDFFNIIFLFFKKNIKIIACQTDIVSHGKASVTWQWHMSLLDVKSLNIVLYLLFCLNLVLIFLKLN